MRRGRRATGAREAMARAGIDPDAIPMPVPTPRKGGVMDEHTDIVVGPIETRARQLIGTRPAHVSESEYIYKVRELVDWMATVQQQWSEAERKGGRQ